MLFVFIITDTYIRVCKIPVLVNIFIQIVLYYCVVEEAVTINLTESKLIWSSSSLAYSLKLSWTIPEIYNLSHLIQSFRIFDPNYFAIHNREITAVRTIGPHKVNMF